MRIVWERLKSFERCETFSHRVVYRRNLIKAYEVNRFGCRCPFRALFCSSCVGHALRNVVALGCLLDGCIGSTGLGLE